MSFTRIIAKKLARYDDKNAFASQLRSRRIQPFLTLIEDLSQGQKRVDILDVGGTHRYWNIVDRRWLIQYGVHIHLLNLPGSLPPPADPQFSFIEGDICEGLPFKTNAFDLVHSNSVIEHVGPWTRMQAFAQELRRLAPHYWVQTPNFWFPIEPHCMVPFFHWLPEPLRVSWVMKSALGHWPKQENVATATQWVQRAHLLDEKMMRSLFPDAMMHVEHFMGLRKSLIAFRHAPTPQRGQAHAGQPSETH